METMTGLEGFGQSHRPNCGEELVDNEEATRSVCWCCCAARFDRELAAERGSVALS